MARTPVYQTDPSDLVALADRMSIQADVPATALQAMMEAVPHREPRLSKEELLDTMDVVVAVLDDPDILTERERWIVYARVWRRMSVRSLAHELALSKTHVDRIYKSALVKLGDALRESGAASDIAELFGRVEL